MKAWASQVDAEFKPGVDGPNALQAAIDYIEVDLGKLQKETIDEAQNRLKIVEKSPRAQPAIPVQWNYHRF